jgi:isoleucyl-tRNA synthetase
VSDFLPAEKRHLAEGCRKGTDTMDVWFDSGVSWSLLREEGLRADIYLEGSDQHRGWFQSSLLTAVASEGDAPYKNVVTHGFVLDQKGRKMSKSLGNVVGPLSIIKGGKVRGRTSRRFFLFFCLAYGRYQDLKKDPAYGSDVLRHWAAAVDYTKDVPMGKDIISQLSEATRKVRNTARFMLGNLGSSPPASLDAPLGFVGRRVFTGAQEQFVNLRADRSICAQRALGA